MPAIYIDGKFSGIVSNLRKKHKKSSYVAICITGQLRDACYNKISIPSIQVLIRELKKQGYTPVIFFHVNTKNSFKFSEWHYRHLIKTCNKFTDRKAVDEFMKQFDTTPETFLDEIKILDCEYFCSFYTDNDFVNFTGVNFSCDPLSNIFLNDHGHKIIQEFIDRHRPGTKFWEPSGMLTNVHVSLRARYVACRNMQIQFEKKHDMQFEYTIITRPEMVYYPNFDKLDTDSIYYRWDHLTMYPNYIYNPIIDNIVPIIQSITILISKTQGKVRMKLNHFIEHNFLDLNDMSHYYKKSMPIPFKLNLVSRPEVQFGIKNR